MTQQLDTINIDGKDFVLADLPQNIQEAIGVFNELEAERIQLQRDAFKNQLAQKALSDEIIAAVKTLETEQQETEKSE